MRPLGWGIWRTVHTAQVRCDNKPRQTSLNHDYNMMFSFHLMNVNILHLKYEYCAQSESCFACYSHCYITWFPLMTRIVASQCPLATSFKGHYAHDALPHTFSISLFKSIINNSATIIHIYNKSANIIESCNITFDTNDCWNFPKTVPVFGIESMVTRVCLCYMQDYLTPGICSLIKPTALEKLMPKM